MARIHPIKLFSATLMELYHTVIHFFLPHFCLICRTTEIKSHDLICENCWKNLPIADSPEKIMLELKNNLSGECYFSGAISLWKFSPETQTIIHYLKYRSFGKIAKTVGKKMAEKLTELNFTPKNVTIIPIPLHKTRIRERGYNQSALLCKAIAEETGFAVDERILKRVRYTQSQTKLDAIARQKNMQNAFAVTDKEKICDKTIISVDDIITTGATMNACARELQKYGVKTVIIFSAVKV
jgi:ComF family protein